MNENENKNIRNLIYKFQNPYNSCEAVYYCPEKKRFYVFLPTRYNEPKSWVHTCTPSRGYYEADCPVKEGITFVIKGKEYTTDKHGMIDFDMNRKKRKYIAGRITGNYNYYLQFMEAEVELTASDTIVLNPAKTSARIDGLEHAEYMHICKAMIDIADEVHFLPNWQQSKGAKEEHLYARLKGKEIYYMGDGGHE